MLVVVNLPYVRPEDPGYKKSLSCRDAAHRFRPVTPLSNRVIIDGDATQRGVTSLGDVVVSGSQ